MNTELSVQEVAQMAKTAASSIRAHHSHLSELDSACGDGDHGTTMLRILERVESGVEYGPDAALRTLLEQAGMQILGSDGGASSSLLGAFTLGMAAALRCDCTHADCRELRAALAAGLSRVRMHTSAQLGDKTLLDALIPAVTAFSDAVESGKTLLDAIGDAARAARAGADATAAITAKIGRGRYLGERTRGYQDPGAATVALLFTGFYSGLNGPERGIDDAGH